MRRPILLLAAALILSGCPIGDRLAPPGPIPGSTIPQSKISADGPIPPGTDVVIADFVDGGVAYRVERLSENCIRVEATPDGRDTRTEDVCAQPGWLSATGGCYERDELGHCTLELDYWLVGRMTPGAAYVCVANLDDGIGPVRFLDPLPDGLIVEQAIRGEAPYPHYFDANGGQVGDPPLDAPSTVIYAMCSDVGPWRTDIQPGAVGRVAQDVGIHFVMPNLAADTYWAVTYPTPDGGTMGWQTRFGNWTPEEGIGGIVVFPLDIELSFGRTGATITLPAPPADLEEGDQVAVVDLTDAFDLDPDGHILGLHPERATVTWMSWSDWRNAIEGDGGRGA